MGAPVVISGQPPWSLWPWWNAPVCLLNALLRLLIPSSEWLMGDSVHWWVAQPVLSRKLQRVQWTVGCLDVLALSLQFLSLPQASWGSVSVMNYIMTTSLPPSRVLLVLMEYWNGAVMAVGKVSFCCGWDICIVSQLVDLSLNMGKKCEKGSCCSAWSLYCLKSLFWSLLA